MACQAPSSLARTSCSYDSPLTEMDPNTFIAPRSACFAPSCHDPAIHVVQADVAQCSAPAFAFSRSWSFSWGNNLRLSAKPLSKRQQRQQPLRPRPQPYVHSCAHACVPGSAHAPCKGSRVCSAPSLSCAHASCDEYTTPEVKTAAATGLAHQTERACVSAACRSQSPVNSGKATVLAACRLLDAVVCRACPQLPGTLVFSPMYHSVSIPSICAGTYLSRHLASDALRFKEHLAEPVVLQALLLLDRLLVRQAASGLHLCAANVHRLLLVCMLLSAKTLDDDAYCNAYWARVGGVSLAHLNELEVHTLLLLDFKVFIHPDELEPVRSRLAGV